MKKLYAIPQSDGSVGIMEIPPVKVRCEGVEELVRYKAGELSVLRDGAWFPVIRLSGYELIYATPQEAIAKWKPEHQAAVDHAGIREIQPDDIPQDRTYRNAWTATDKGIEHDMVKAREIHRENLRQERRPLLAALDIAYMRADEAGNAKAKADIATQKQALRDVTKHPAIEAAQTTEALMKAGLQWA